MKVFDTARGLRPEKHLPDFFPVYHPGVPASSAAGRRGSGLLACLLLALLALGCPCPAAAAQERPVAMVYQQPITAGMLPPTTEGISSLKLRFGEEISGIWAREARRKALRQQIVHKLLRIFCAEQRIEVSETDVRDYLAYLRWRTRERRDRLVREEERLAIRKRRPGLPEDERTDLLRRLQRIEKRIGRLDQKLENRVEEIPEAWAGTKDQAALARDEILRWKGYKALYERYGGEVMCDAKGLVPVDAIRALVAERLSTFGVVLPDPDYQDLFDDFNPPMLGMHFPVSRHQAETYFSRPWWITAAEGTSTTEVGPQQITSGN